MNSFQRAEELNDSLRHAFGEGATFPRDKWDRIVSQHYNLGIEAVQLVTKTGETRGFWIREVGAWGGPGGSGRRVGSVRLLPQAKSPPELQSPQAESVSA